MKKHSVLLLFLVCVLLFSASCSATSPNSAPPAYDAPGAAGGDAGGAPEAGSDSYERAATGGKTYSASLMEAEIDSASIKKIVRNARAELEVEDVKAAYRQILTRLETDGGYEFSQSQESSGDYVYITATLKIPPEKLSDFLQFFEEVGEVLSANTSMEDITDDYYDAELRVKSMRASLTQYYKLLEDTKSVEEILAVQRIIDQITADIEVLEGKLKLWDRLVGESTVELRIYEKSDPTKFTKQAEWNSLSLGDMGQRIQFGFLTVLQNIIAIFQWIIIAVLSALPLIILVAAVLIVVRIWRKKKKKDK